jgi:hypothetical protein
MTINPTQVYPHSRYLVHMCIYINFTLTTDACVSTFIDVAARQLAFDLKAIVACFSPSSASLLDQSEESCKILQLSREKCKSLKDALTALGKQAPPIRVVHFIVSHKFFLVVSTCHDVSLRFSKESIHRIH